MSSDTPAGAAKKPGAAQPPASEPDAGREEAIRHRAYLLYVERGCIAGHEVEDWLRAEALVSQERDSALPLKPAPAKKRAAPPKPASPAAKEVKAVKVAKSAKTTKAPGAAAKKRAPPKPRGE